MKKFFDFIFGVPDDIVYNEILTQELDKIIKEYGK